MHGHHIANPHAAVKPTPWNSAAFVDTIELFFRAGRLPIGIRKHLDRIQGHPIFIKECHDWHDQLTGYRVVVHQPTVQAIQLLDQFRERHGGVLCRVDVAADFTFETEDEAQKMGQWLVTRTIMRWRRPGEMIDFENDGVSWVRQDGRKRRSNRDLVLYSDKPSKISANGPPCAHLELRFQRAEACRREHWIRVRDVLDINPEQLFARHLALSDIGENHVRNVVRQEVDRYRGKAMSPIDDRYCAGIRYRTPILMQKTGANRAQRVKDKSRRLSTEMTPFDLGIPRSLSFRPRS